MVNDILDLSKIEDGKIAIDLKSFDFGKMLKRSPSIIQTIAYEKQIQIIASIEPNLGWLNGDETKLKQVIYNLFSNAVKFTESGKRIGIEAISEGDDFIISIWDQGSGIPKDYLDKIFNPFEQVDGGRTSIEKGTGLGLAISKKLIELHQGTISATSIVGEGSRFTITLPGRISAEEEVTQKNATPPIGISKGVKKNTCILVTEDNLTNRELIEAALEDYQLDFADSGEKAVTMALDKEYDLILMDIQLSGIDGIETMKQIRKSRENQIPIIALTAYAMKGDEEKYLQEGFNDYLSKPINIDRLNKTIQEKLK